MIQRAYCEARKTTAPAMSLGAPSVPIGTIRLTRGSASSSIQPIWPWPGATAFTRAPRGAGAKAVDLALASSTAFDEDDTGR